MENKVTIAEDADNLSLQEYADQYCAGDRLHAIYILLLGGKDGSFDRYLPEISPYEANFVLAVIQSGAERASGGKTEFQKLSKANDLAESLGFEIEDVQKDSPNPFIKKFVFSVLGLVLGIVVSVFSGIISKQFNIDLHYIGEGIICIASYGVVQQLLNCLRFHKLKKNLPDTPVSEIFKNNDNAPAPYEEIVNEFRKKYQPQKPIEVDEAKQLMRAAGKRLTLSALWLLGYIGVAIYTIVFGAVAGIAGSLIGIFGLIAFFIWQIIPLFRCVGDTRNIRYMNGADDSLRVSMEKQQNLYSFVFICIAGAYLIVGAVGIVSGIMIALHG